MKKYEFVDYNFGVLDMILIWNIHKKSFQKENFSVCQWSEEKHFKGSAFYSSASMELWFEWFFMSTSTVQGIGSPFCIRLANDIYSNPCVLDTVNKTLDAGKFGVKYWFHLHDK